GIGRAVALTILKDGYTVVLAGRRERALVETAGLALPGAKTLVVPTNVADAASVAALFEQTQKAFGRVDLLFNNAGVNIPATPLEEVALEDWRRVIDINLTGLFLCTQHAFRLMKS